MYRLTLTIFFTTVFGSISVRAQEGDSLVLTCPLHEKLEAAPERSAISIGAPDLKANWICRTDTSVRAVLGAMVSLLLHDEDGKWEVFLVRDEFTFWYSGIRRPLVVKGQKLKPGETIGLARPGDRIVLQMMDSESSVDPKPFLDCAN